MWFMPKVTLFYAQSDPLGLCPKWLSFMPKVTPSVNLCPNWLSSVFGEKVHSVVLTCGLCPKWLSFYAQSDPLECRGVNLCPKWLFYAPSDPLSTLNDLCPKWLKKCALSDPPTHRRYHWYIYVSLLLCHPLKSLAHFLFARGER